MLSYYVSTLYAQSSSATPSNAHRIENDQQLKSKALDSFATSAALMQQHSLPKGRLLILDMH
jgi:hypothetical protein